jgi:hypothetical protein
MQSKCYKQEFSITGHLSPVIRLRSPVTGQRSLVTGYYCSLPTTHCPLVKVGQC